MKTDECKKQKRRFSTLIILVLFVFVILFVSVAFAGGVTLLLVRSGIMLPPSTSRMPLLITFMLMVSLFIGTVLACVGGDYFLRPLRDLIEATKEVGAGNFDIHVEVKSTAEMVKLADSFNDMAKELGSIETLRSDFVSNISHEFKTPVVSIRGFARRLKRDNLTKEERDEYLDIIISETERLTTLSTNVLLLSKLESTERVIEKAAYRLDEQIRRAILLVSPQIDQKELELDIDLPPVELIGNEETLRHLWINLLGNAIKFSPHGGVVCVSLRLDGDYCVAEVSDHGPGMDEEVQKHLFDKFYQGDGSRGTEGNGLGLSLVKRILDLSGGAVTVDSELGKGSRFTVYLPVNG